MSAGNGAAPVQVKAGRHREATLYHALHGAGAADGRSLAELREAALEAYERLELPVWRRSGFWTTTLQSLDLDALTTTIDDRSVPEVVERTLPERPRAGRIVQSAGAVVQVELDEQLAEQGVILCSLEQAFARHGELASAWYSKRLTAGRHKLEAANAAFWRGGAFLYVPDSVTVEDPFEIVYAIDRPGVAQYGRTLVVGAPGSDFRVHEYDLAEDFDAQGAGPGGQALHAGAFELYLQDGARCRLAQYQDWGSGEVFDVSTRFVGVGRDAYCHWLPALLGGHLVRQHLELAVMDKGGDMAFRGVFFAEEDEHLDVFAVDLHETGPSGGDVHWRGTATGESRASFEGLIQIDPGAQQTHTYLQIHTMMLSPKARVDAIPSVLVAADDVSASHGGTVGELDETAIFYMQSRGLDRAAAVRVIVEGFFEPLISELQDEPLEELVRGKIAEKLATARDDIEAYATSR
jgi:Fe-S cluster assembly scaffold protein SufB